jgi:hypothetical protein
MRLGRHPECGDSVCLPVSGSPGLALIRGGRHTADRLLARNKQRVSFQVFNLLLTYVNVPPPAGPPGFRPGFCPLQVCIKLPRPKKKVDLPRAHGPGPPFLLLLPIWYRPPPVVVARAQASRPVIQAAAAYIYFISHILSRCL